LQHIAGYKNGAEKEYAVGSPVENHTIQSMVFKEEEINRPAVYDLD